MRAYKFRSSAQLEFIFDIIINRRLYCSELSALNDPTEGLFAYSYPAGNESPTKDIQKVIEAKRKYRICSLSADFQSHLLWAHYAGGFNGVAIEVRLPQSRYIRRVEYQGVFAFLDVRSKIIHDAAACEILFSKYQEWSYEKEVRILNESESFTWGTR